MRILVVSFAASVLVLAGCGGGGGHRLSHDDFVGRANAICSDYRARIAAVPRPRSNLSSVARYVDRVVGLVRQGVAQQRKLLPPAADERTWAALVAANERVIRTTEKISSEAHAKNAGAVRRASTQLSAENRAAQRFAARLGLDDCSG
jgi:hypothetical protein